MEITERDESQMEKKNKKLEMQWRWGLAERQRGVKERAPPELETDGQVDGSVVCITD